VGASVTLTIDDPDTEGLDYTAVQTATECPWNPVSCIEFPYYAHALNDLNRFHPGLVFTMTDGMTTKEMVVANLTVTGSDIQADTIFGTSDPNVQVHVDLCVGGDCSQQINRLVSADGSGDWLANFADDATGDVYDVTRYDTFFVSVVDEDGDETTKWWGISIPFLAANLTENKVYGFAWEMDTSITLEIDDPNTSEPIDFHRTTTVTEWWYDQGQVVFDLGSFMLVPGQTVYLKDAYITRSHVVVSNLSVAEILVDTDTISGTAEPGSLVLVGEICWFRDCAGAEATADGNGNWQVEYPWQLTQGSIDKAWVRDEDGDLTEVVWGVPFVDTDGDGVYDVFDLCPSEDATGFDADLNGCLDTVLGLSQILITLPEGSISAEIENSLTSKVDAALKSVDKEKDQAAVNQLQAFINELNAQRWHKISDEAADLLILSALNVIAQIQSGD
jgi:hypothetical protein